MICRRYSDALNEVAAGGAAPAALDLHLHGCAACRSRLAMLRRALASADDQLQALAAVEPSATFLARLRAAVAAPAAPPAWRPGWLWSLLATAATLVAAFAVVLAIRVPQRENFKTTTQYAPPAATPARVPDRNPASAIAVTDQAPRRSVSRRAAVEPQVLVPSEDARALAELVAMVNREWVAPAALLASGQPMAPLVAPAPIHIPPIEIVPLDPALNPGT